MKKPSIRRGDSPPCTSPAPPLDPARADGVARSLHRAAVAWAVTFLKSRAGLDRALAEQLTTETLAFGLALLDERVREFGSDGAAFAHRVRRAAWILHARWRTAPGRSRQLTAGDAPTREEAEDVSEFSLACRLTGGEGGGAFEFTEAMHLEFCELTGLGTNELVGHGANLAALGFYLVVHGRVFASRLRSRAERRWLVQALRECREHLERGLATWLACPAAAARPVSAAIGR